MTTTTTTTRERNGTEKKSRYFISIASCSSNSKEQSVYQSQQTTKLELEQPRPESNQEIRTKACPHSCQQYTHHSYRPISLTPIRIYHSLLSTIYTSLLSASSPHSYQHIPLAPMSLCPSYLSAYAPCSLCVF